MKTLLRYYYVFLSVVTASAILFFGAGAVYCDETDVSLNNAEVPDNYVNFWAKEAEKLDWFQKWTITEEKVFPFVRWFKDGKINACYNCLDRH